MVTSNDIIIMKAGLNQLELVVKLFKEYRTFYKKLANIEEEKKFIYDRIINQQSVIFLATHRNKNPLGFVQLYPSFSSVNLTKIWILNDLYFAQTARHHSEANIYIQKSSTYALDQWAKLIIIYNSNVNHWQKC